jgi:hypothetical protein
MGVEGQGVALQSLGRCGFQLGRSRGAPQTRTQAVWRYGKWWIPSLPTGRLQREGTGAGES